MMTPGKSFAYIAAVTAYGAAVAFRSPWWAVAWACVWTLVAALAIAFELGRKSRPKAASDV